VDTTVGRALLSEILPKGLPFSNINKALKKKEISRLINVSFRKCGLKETVIFADKLLQSGFRWPRVPASRSPSTTCWCPRRSRA
jgi:DNA-directed RNA polymerase subunit beta'